jgi:hypothetical protein
MTQQEQQAIEKASKECANSCCAPADEVIELNRSLISEYLLFAFMQGAKALDRLRKPSEELVNEIYDLIEKYHYDEYAIWSVEDSMRCSNEIANLVTKREAELLEAAKDALTTFYGIGCTDEADIVQALKKAISKY